MFNAFISRAGQQQLYRLAWGLAIFTIVYNIAEGVVATWLGFEDDSLALFGFGIDSFIEMISGLGIAHLLARSRLHPEVNRDQFEKTALRVTGVAFYLLVAGLVCTGIYNIITGHQPQTTRWGVVIAFISIVIMWFLIIGKTGVGKKLQSEAILADAACTRVCIFMSVILLVSSGIYELTQFPYVDSIGSLGIAFLSFREGRECFEKARSGKLSCHCEDHENTPA